MARKWTKGNTSLLYSRPSVPDTCLRARLNDCGRAGILKMGVEFSEHAVDLVERSLAQDVAENIHSVKMGLVPVDETVLQIGPISDPAGNQFAPL